jgi:hypothetical protein
MGCDITGTFPAVAIGMAQSPGNEICGCGTTNLSSVEVLVLSAG